MTESKVALWRGRVAEWRASGLTADEFAARHGLVASTLRWWALRLERTYKEVARPGAAPKSAVVPGPEPRPRSKRTKASEPATIRVAKLVPVALSPTEATRYAAFVIELCEGGARITIERGADLKTAAKLVATLATTRKR